MSRVMFTEDSHQGVARPCPYHVPVRFRLPLLVLAGLVVAHDAVFASDVGFAALFGALTRSGHGDAWTLLSVAGLGGAALIAIALIVRLVLLRREIARLQQTRGGTNVRAAFGFRPDVAEVRRLWPRLFLAIALGFLVQENVEAIFGGGHAAGLEPLLGAHPLAVPVLLILTLAMAALGALVRRHTRALEQLVSQLRAQAPRHAAARTSRPSLGALHHRDSIRLRPQAGRAPPLHAVLVSA
jgi:hypothetical protein